MTFTTFILMVVFIIAGVLLAYLLAQCAMEGMFR